jgi:hypothetical protein
VRRADGVCRLDTFHVMARRHADVGDDGVRCQTPHRIEKIGRGTDRGHDLDRSGVLQQAAGPFSNEVMVLGDDDPQGQHLIASPAPTAGLVHRPWLHLRAGSPQRPYGKPQVAPVAVLTRSRG